MIRKGAANSLEKEYEIREQYMQKMGIKDISEVPTPEELQTHLDGFRRYMSMSQEELGGRLYCEQSLIQRLCKPKMTSGKPVPRMSTTCYARFFEAFSEDWANYYRAYKALHREEQKPVPESLVSTTPGMWTTYTCERREMQEDPETAGKNTKTLRFLGYSDDTFGEYNVFNEDYDNCASMEPIVYRVTAEGKSLYVIGQYNRMNNGCWDIGVVQEKEQESDHDMPNGPSGCPSRDTPLSWRLMQPKV